MSEKLQMNPLRSYTKKLHERILSDHQGIPRELMSQSTKDTKLLEDPNETSDATYENIPKSIEDNPRIEIYYFDHGYSSYFRTTDLRPAVVTERYAEKTDEAATRFWAEIFGSIHIGTTFVTSFILQLLRFILYSLIRPLTIGIIQMISDYFIKPLLTMLFNGLIQPILILFYNIATSLRDLCEPIAEALGFFLREIANLFRAIRLAEINSNNNTHSPT